MLKNLNLKHIFYFWSVAKEESIKKASAVLNVSQSSISEQTRILEQRVGVDLFNRSQKKMSLSSEGKLLFETLDQFFPVLEELFEGLVHHKSTKVKFLRVGFCPTLSAELKHRINFSFIKDINFTVKAVQGENSFLCDAFDNDEIDLFYTTNSQVALHGKFEKESILDKNFSIVTNPNVYKSLPRINKLKSLNSVKFINYTSDSDLHFKIFRFLHTNDLRPQRIAEIDDIDLIKKTIINHDCFAILPSNSIKQESKSGELVQVGKPIKELKSTIFAYYKPSFKSDDFMANLTS